MVAGSSTKRLIVGDIHGCYAKLQDLLDKAALPSGVEVIAVGDIIDRGPDSALVLEFFRTYPRARSLMGNHERKHVRFFRGELQPQDFTLAQIKTRQQLGDGYADAVANMASLPYYLDQEEALIIHAFVEPGVPLAKQRETVLAGTLRGRRYLETMYYHSPYRLYELYEGSKPLIVGHQAYRHGKPLVFDDRVYGIDTEACSGGALTGIILPEFEIVSVPSRDVYWRGGSQE